jgi:hypothetical protein
VRRLRFTRYFKQAFLNRWNLLISGGAMGLALLSGRADIFVPLVLAGEMLYVGLLGSRPRFQDYVDAQDHKLTREEDSGATQRTLATILRSLPPRSLDRFEALRTRCVELRQIATQIKNPGGLEASLGLDKSQLAGLDRLLWIYLRMLFTQHALERFLAKTSEPQIQKDITDLEAKLASITRIGDEVQRQKFARTLEDNLQTCRDRLANYQKARANYDFIQLEIDRLENKIHSLSELAVNRQEPDFVSAQVDQVASSMLQTEQTMNDLRFATGLDSVEETVPELLPETVRQTA